MRVQHVAQAAMSWPDTTETDRHAGARLTETIERIRWRLWHRQVERALDLIAETVVTVGVAADDKSPIAAAARKVARLLGDLETYVSGQSDIIIDYATASPMRRTNFDGDHREHGAMAAASANECPAANALVSAGRSFDAESSDLGRERHARPGPCRGRMVGPPAVSASGLTTPTYWTVSCVPGSTSVSSGGSALSTRRSGYVHTPGGLARSFG